MKAFAKCLVVATSCVIVTSVAFGVEVTVTWDSTYGTSSLQQVAGRLTYTENSQQKTHDSSTPKSIKNSWTWLEWGGGIELGAGQSADSIQGLYRASSASDWTIYPADFNSEGWWGWQN